MRPNNALQRTESPRFARLAGAGVGHHVNKTLCAASLAVTLGLCTVGCDRADVTDSPRAHNDPALSLFLESDQRCHGRLSGPITVNTAIALDDFISRNRCESVTIVVGGPGGDIDAAMRMGRTLRKLKALTFASELDPCLSACTLVLAGGASRAVSGRNAVGVHSYYRTVGTLSEQDAIDAYDRSYAAVRAYLEEMRIPLVLLDMSYSVPPWKMRMLSAREIQDTHLGEDDPVHRDVREAKSAARAGVTIREHYERLARVETECGNPQTVAAVARWDKCRRSILDEAKANP